MWPSLVYCDFYAYKEQLATSLLAALLRQLVAGVELIQGAIKEAFERAKRVANGQTLGLSEIRGMLVLSLSSMRWGYICIDALDEFPTKHRPELWDSLRHVIRECLKARFFVTGRLHI